MQHVGGVEQQRVVKGGVVHPEHGDVEGGGARHRPPAAVFGVVGGGDLAPLGRVVGRKKKVWQFDVKLLLIDQPHQPPAVDAAPVAPLIDEGDVEITRRPVHHHRFGKFPGDMMSAGYGSLSRSSWASSPLTSSKS